MENPIHGCGILAEGAFLSSKRYTITNPPVPSGQVYYFTTESGLLYEVRFGRKTDNYFSHVINFGVRSDDFEHEYAATNKGEIYSIIPTVIEIICRFQKEHPNNNYYEFTGEFKEFNDSQEASIRSRLYLRIAQRFINTRNWKTELCGNKVVLSKIGR
jgi:hypothetical protein